MDEATIHGKRKQASEWLDWASNGSKGREPTEGTYAVIVEGLVHESSCAILAHGMLYAVGVRLPFINRKEHHGWVPGVSISRLAYTGNRKLAKPHMVGQALDAGDVIVIWDHPKRKDGSTVYDEHAVCIAADLGDGTWATVEGGQPGIKAFHRTISANGRFMSVGGRPGRRVQSVLLLADVLRAAEANGMLV